MEAAMPKQQVEYQFQDLKLGKIHARGHAFAYGPKAELIHVGEYHVDYLKERGIEEGAQFSGAFHPAKKGFPFELVAIE
jgi:hypothetical protein